MKTHPSDWIPFQGGGRMEKETFIQLFAKINFGMTEIDFDYLLSGILSE